MILKIESVINTRTKKKTITKVIVFFSYIRLRRVILPFRQFSANIISLLRSRNNTFVLAKYITPTKSEYH